MIREPFPDLHPEAERVVVPSSVALDAWSALRAETPTSGLWPVALGPLSTLNEWRNLQERPPDPVRALARADAWTLAIPEDIEARALEWHLERIEGLGAPAGLQLPFRQGLEFARRDPLEEWERALRELPAVPALSESHACSAEGYVATLARARELPTAAPTPTRPAPEVGDDAAPVPWAFSTLGLHLREVPPEDALCIALVPAAGVELPAWLWSEAPDPGEVIPYLRSWRERYGAEVISAEEEGLELAVARLPASRVEALRLAREHYALFGEPHGEHDLDYLDAEGTPLIGQMLQLAFRLLAERTWSFAWRTCYWDQRLLAAL